MWIKYTFFNKFKSHMLKLGGENKKKANEFKNFE